MPQYEDFICKACSAVCSFLCQYPSSIWAVGRHPDISLDVSVKNDVPEQTLSVCTSVKHDNDGNPDDSANADLTVAPEESAGKDSFLSELPENNSCSNETINEVDQTASCVLGTSQSSASMVVENKPMFLSKNWRGALCRCEKCINNYKLKNISFLLDEEDSIAEYEKIAKQKREEKLQQQEGAELKMFDNLGHVEKIEILSGIADMKDEIRTFLVFSQSLVFTYTMKNHINAWLHVLRILHGYMSFLLCRNRSTRQSLLHLLIYTRFSRT